MTNAELIAQARAESDMFEELEMALDDLKDPLPARRTPTRYVHPGGGKKDRQKARDAFREAESNE
jgi:hypothetical protein